MEAKKVTIPTIPHPSLRSLTQSYNTLVIATATVTMKFILSIISTSLLAKSVVAEIISIEWTDPESGKPYPNGAAQVGDTVQFKWEEFHNVNIHPTGDCSKDGAILIGDQSGAKYTFTADDVGTVTFACDVGKHCSFGQIITYDVTLPTPTESPSQSPPATASPAPTSPTIILVPPAPESPTPTSSTPVAETPAEEEPSDSGSVNLGITMSLFATAGASLFL
mmetsp:Transcript_1899/g.3404  ORF Transcript_1899/g.3404 Transcript_1899/m.3404 type:complete len:222 (+) Transcript_1899:81-746(+)